MLLEVGYVGNYAKRLYQGYALQQAPYMYTLGGQSFATAFSNIAKSCEQTRLRLSPGVANPRPSLGVSTQQPYESAIHRGIPGWAVRGLYVLHADGSIRSTKAFPNRALSATIWRGFSPTTSPTSGNSM